MFYKTTVRLTGLYLGIIMAISLFFSAGIYRLYVQEFEHNLSRQEAVIQRLPSYRLSPDARDQLLDAHDTELAEAKAHIAGRLLVINLVILLGGGLLSYFLAKSTLQPIKDSHQALERFTADASHELRTPITAMQSEIEVTLMDPKLSLPVAKKQLASNLEELNRLTAIADGLLRLAQLEETVHELKVVSLRSVVQASLKQLQTAAKANKVSCRLTEGEDVSVLADKTALVEATSILIDNAIKFSPKDSQVTVTVSSNDRFGLLAVQDKGPGISKSDQDHIFDRFYQVDTARNQRSKAGHGLGLAIGRSLVEQFDGTISVASTPGNGATFTIQVPLA